MIEVSPWLRFVMAALATWRVTHLLAREDGPAGLLARLRIQLGQGLFGKLMDCFYCLSLWVALPLALLVCQELWDRVLAWLALSGAACLMERIGREPVVIQPLSQSAEGEQDYAMLRSDTERVERLGETRDSPGSADNSNT
jgi:Protein of unknown function (DUF1360)